jgi:hypothetical protein
LKARIDPLLASPAVILEGVMTTINADGTVNISPMGPRVDESLEKFVFRPYRTSTTYSNLKRTGHGIFHVTDDVELLAQSAVGTPDPLPAMDRFAEAPPASDPIEGYVLTGACRWYAMRVRALDDRQERTEIMCDVTAWGRLRDFIGFNRAKHAVVEAAILATRTKFLPADDVLGQFDKLRVMVEKTGGPAEHRAFDFLQRHVANCYAAKKP